MKLILNGESVDLSTSIEGIPVIPLTQAEYDALTDEEKNAEKLYLITDASSDSSGSSSEEIYSTEETKIGTWINGKPLYRKVLQVTGPANNSSSTILHGVSNLESVVNLYAFVVDSYGHTEFAPYYQDYNNTHQTFMLYANNSKTSIILSVYNSYNGSHANRPWTIVMEYTKTTDTATRRLKG